MGDVDNLDRDSAPPLKQINLLKGWPNPSLLPTKALSQASQVVFSDPKILTPGLLYAPDPGYQPLREEITKWLSEFYAPAIEVSSTSKTILQSDPDRICITGGASQNLACLLQVFTDPAVTTVWMVAPCYYLACRIFEDSGLRMRAVPEGEDGIDLNWLEESLKLFEEKNMNAKPLKLPRPGAKTYKHIIYLVPTFSNPSGKTMSLSTRESLVRLARTYDALVISDDVYDFLQWRTTPNTGSQLTHAPVPRIIDIDRTLTPVPGPEDFGNAVSNGSFSKIVGPGCRTAWAEASPKLTYGLSQCGSSRSGGAPSQLVATFLAEMLKDMSLQQHIQNILCPAYQRRHATILSAIEKWLLPLGVKLGETEFGEERLFGGYFIWLKLPGGVRGETVVKKAKDRENLIVSGGKLFEVHGDEKLAFNGEIRLCFAWEQEENLTEGVQRLGKVLNQLLKKA